MVCSTWSTFCSRAFRRTPIEVMVAKTANGTSLKRELTFLDLVMFGLGSMIGVGVFVVTGQIAHDAAGPSIILSYVVAGFAALLLAQVYAQFAADIPVSGVAYNYVDFVFGEFAAWLVGSTLQMGCVFGMGAGAKAFTGYFSMMLGFQSDAWMITLQSTDRIVIDIAGALLVIFLTALLAYGIRESFIFNAAATGLCVLTIACVLGLSLPNIDTKNFSPFFPAEFGSVGAFHGASFVFYSYMGFESQASVAEEAKNPSRDVPLSILTALSITTVIYVAMAAALIGMSPYGELDVRAAYATVFEQLGWNWFGRVVAFGAVCGIVTSLFGSICTVCRLTMVLSRDGFLPRALESINERTKTPLNATLLIGCLGTAFTLLVDISSLLSMITIGTFFNYCIVCMASIWRRYIPLESRVSEIDLQPAHPLWVSLHLALLVIASLFEGLAVERGWPFWAWFLSITCFLLVAASLTRFPVIFESGTSALGSQPSISCLAILCCVHLTVTLGTEPYLPFAVWLFISTTIYLAYGMHNRDSASYERVSA